MNDWGGGGGKVIREKPFEEGNTGEREKEERRKKRGTRQVIKLGRNIIQ